MKVFTIIAIFSVLITYTLAIQCLPGYCEKIKCNNDKVVEECKKKQGISPSYKFEVMEKASACACCSACVRILELGDDCMLLHGVATSKRCGPGLQCDTGSRQCIKLH